MDIKLYISRYYSIEELAKRQPNYIYDGRIPTDSDRLDYIELTVKAVRLG